MEYQLKVYSPVDVKCFAFVYFRQKCPVFKVVSPITERVEFDFYRKIWFIIHIYLIYLKIILLLSQSYHIIYFVNVPVNYSVNVIRFK